MNKRLLLMSALGLSIAGPTITSATVVSFHDANQGYHYYGGYNVLMYGQGAAVDPGNNIWNGFGKYGGPGSTDFFSGAGGPNPDSAHGAVPSNSPGQPYAWHSGTSASGTSLFSPLNSGASGTGNANSDGTISPVTLSLSYSGSDNGLNAGASDTRITQGTPSKIFSEAALVSGTNLGTFTLGSVPAGSYDLFLYGANYDGDRGATFAVAAANGGTALGGFTATDNPGNGGVGGPLQTYILGADYVEFLNVTPDSSGNITGTWGAVSNPITGQTGEGDFNGLQLVSVPEPASIALIGMVGVGLLSRRRRKA